ncbi:diguanylate cyclase domain-containing protein [uncultured Desulfobacter sp.]|uniref:diguanylate cyclase n=1 Tax=uncultured Desulfobacter sp. TaxID=240139 RepID=UPI0029F47DDE|nr:diguanylate cyclase [uncultured Desulfobacter sp.]
MKRNDDLTNLKTFIELCSAIAYGNYDKADVDALFELTKEEKHPLIAQLSESIGLMLVKIEGREFALEMRIEELQKANEKIDEYSKTLALKVAERTKELQGKNKALTLEVQKRQKIQKALEMANEKLILISNQDGLTGLANRRRFDDYLSREWFAHKRIKKEFSLILCDVDHFKFYNDTYGHRKGDDCLKRIAQAIEGCMRRPRDMAARYGGEEFAAILPETGLYGALQMAENIRSQVETLYIPHESSKICDHVTISLGVAVVIPNPDLTEKDFVEMADISLYEAKEEGGRNCVRYRSNLN